MKNLQIHALFIVWMALTAAVGRAQETLGLPFSPYSGLSSLAINPALLTGSKLYVDVNLVSGDIFFANDFMYFPADEKTISKLIRRDAGLLNDGPFAWGRSFNYYNNTRDKYFVSSNKVLGPSVMLQAGHHAFALTTSFRSLHSGNHIPYEMPIISYESLSFPLFHGVEFNDNDYSLLSMTWSEIGLSYANNFYERYGRRLTFGLTVKALFGYEGAYFELRNANFEILDTKSVDFKNIDADIGYALPVGYGNELTTNYEPLVKGYGLGLDVGLVFTKLKSPINRREEKKLCAKSYHDYLYKIGLSILDIGSILFADHAERHQFDNVSKYWINFDTIRFRGIENQMRIYSDGFYGDPDKSYAGSSIKIGLPTTISFQFDYHLKRRIYLSALWMHPLKLNARTLWRPAQLALIPHYETRLVGVSLPLSLFNYTEPRLGLAIRLYSLTIGTDRLGWMLGLFDLDGMDFYFSFSFNIGKGVCSGSRRGACQGDAYGNDW